MKKYLSKLILFLIITSVIIAGFWMLILSTESRTMVLDKTVTKVFIGNSTIESGVDDSRLSNTFNFARSREQVEYIYSKAKLILKYNPQIDTLFIGLDDILLFKDWENGNTHFRAHPYLISEWSADDLIELADDTSFNWFTTYFSHPLEISKLRFVFTSRDPKGLNIGKYSILDLNKLSEDIKRNKLHTDAPIGGNIDSVNPLVLHFYKRIESLCQKNNVKMILISTPKHRTVSGDTTYRVFKSRYFPTVPLYDYNNMILPDSCFGDCLHLNYKGARLFTDSLSRELNNRAAY